MRRDPVMGLTTHPCLKVHDLLWEVFGHATDVGVECACRARVASWRTTHAEVDTSGRQRIEDAKDLGHFEGRVVRQHHPSASNANAPGAGGNGGHEDLGRRAHDGGQAVMCSCEGYAGGWSDNAAAWISSRMHAQSEKVFDDMGRTKKRTRYLPVEDPMRYSPVGIGRKRSSGTCL